MEEVEREFVARTVALYGGNKVRAAQALRIGRSGLYAFLKRSKRTP
ncbi:MAG: helix-turn-helix domain-containing protein [Candidatus Binataceae bacterium]